VAMFTKACNFHFARPLTFNGAGGLRREVATLYNQLTFPDVGVGVGGLIIDKVALYSHRAKPKTAGCIASPIIIHA
jgi:hypothetical protein